MTPTALTEASQRVKAGETPTLTVRTLLGWFGAYGRGKHKVAEIRSALHREGLRTWPDFTAMWLDGEVELRPLSSSGPAVPPTAPQQPPALSAPESPDPSDNEDPVPRVGQLAAANRSPVTVTRDARIEEAITLMMAHDYSQIPIMQGERNPDGFVSWRTIGEARAAGRSVELVRDAMSREVAVLRADAHLFEAVRTISERDFILVEGVGKRITGLITTTDVSLHFHVLAQPFLLLAQIEGHLRGLLDARFTADDLLAARDPGDIRPVASAADLSFGEYLRLLQSEGNWAKLKVSLDRKVFLRTLEEVRVVRNAVMHFDPDADGEKAVLLLLDTSRFLDALVQH